MRGTHRIAVLAVISMLATFLLAGTALAQAAPYPPSGSLTCDTSTVTPGSTFTCSANGFAPNSTVSVSATGQSTGAAPWTFNTTTTANASGVASATIQVPDNATGPVSVSFSGQNPDGSPRVVANAAAVTVVQPGAGDDTAAPAPDQMPATGGDVTGGIIAVVALLVVGGGLLAVTRRRRTNVEVTFRRFLPQRAAALLVGAALLLAACSSGEPGAVSWRELTMRLPDGWVELERGDLVLTVADGAPAGEGEPGDLDVSVQFTIEPNADADDWRRFVADEGGEIESDGPVDLDGVPATMVQFAFVTNGTPTRERVIVVPSRQLVILQQPVPVQGQTDAPEVFLDRLDEFDALLESIDFGAPAGYLED